ncbi:hypothetical protein IJT93_05715 [bacterium]|nr:hypothetical protein [bacterium]
MSRFEEDINNPEEEGYSVPDEIRKGVGEGKSTVIPPTVYGVIDTVIDFAQELNDLACEAYNL